MYSYYANQASSLPHFSGHYRQRGSGIQNAYALDQGKQPNAKPPFHEKEYPKEVGRTSSPK